MQTPYSKTNISELLKNMLNEFVRNKFNNLLPNVYLFRELRLIKQMKNYSLKNVGHTGLFGSPKTF